MTKVFIDRITIDLCTQSEIDQVKEQTTEAIKNLASLIYDLNQDFLAYQLGIKKPEDNPIDCKKEAEKAEKEAEKNLSQKDFDEAYKKAEIKTNKQSTKPIDPRIDEFKDSARAQKELKKMGIIPKQTTKPTGGKEQTSKWKTISHKCLCGNDYFKTMKNDTCCPSCRTKSKIAPGANKIASDANKSTPTVNNHIPFDQY